MPTDTWSGAMAGVDIWRREAGFYSAVYDVSTLQHLTKTTFRSGHNAGEILLNVIVGGISNL